MAGVVGRLYLAKIPANGPGSRGSSDTRASTAASSMDGKRSSSDQGRLACVPKADGGRMVVLCSGGD
jgi:hypothetical protein